MSLGGYFVPSKLIQLFTSYNYEYKQKHMVVFPPSRGLCANLTSTGAGN